MKEFILLIAGMLAGSVAANLLTNGRRADHAEPQDTTPMHQKRSNTGSWG